MPALSAISTQSGNGKNASLAITAPLVSKPNSFVFAIAWRKASTRDVMPAPLPISCLFSASTMVLDLLFLQIFIAKARLSSSTAVGPTCVTTFMAEGDSVLLSVSCCNIPFKMLLNCFAGRLKLFCFSRMRVFFSLKSSTAAASKSGAIKTSKNSLLISLATASVIVALVISIPPNALTGSPAKAAAQASSTVVRDAHPQALLCFKIAKVVSLNSAIKLTAASISNRLL